jgi:hypothetical protein
MSSWTSPRAPLTTRLPDGLDSARLDRATVYAVIRTTMIIGTGFFQGEATLAHSSLRIAQAATEFHGLKANLRRLEADAAPAAWDANIEPMRDRMAELTRAIIEARAKTTADLALKAGVLLDWLDPTAADIPGMLSASLCRDIVLMFPTDA